MTKFIKYFTKSLLNEEIAANPAVAPVADDAEAFAGSFEDDGAIEQVEGEVEDITIDPIQKQKILKMADQYAENISQMMLPTIRKLHNDIVSGVFSSIAPDLKGVSDIAVDLAKLSEMLRGNIRDAVADKNKKE